MLERETYRECLNYIERYWEKIIFDRPRSGLFYLGLPYRAVSPNHTRFRHNLFYWDSYFIVLGLVVSGKVDLAKEVVENLAYEMERYGFIPVQNRRRAVFFRKANPPFLTRMIFEVFERTKDREWLSRMMEIAKKEYQNVWQAKPRYLPDLELSRYHPRWPWQFRRAEYESGWDLTSRFQGRCEEMMPVDLNSCLYHYEIDFAKTAQILGKNSEEEAWMHRARERGERMKVLLWDGEHGMFFDYDLRYRRRTPFKTLASYHPLWCGMVSQTQAQALRDNLKHFEVSGGLANTEKAKPSKNQWDWPNGWPGQQYIVIRGLLNFGFKEDAERIATKWLDLNTEIFLKTRTLWEKYDVVNRAVGREGLYPTQPGFAWTNAIFLRLLHELS